MTSTKSVWMTRQAYKRLERELAALGSAPSLEVPDDLMDYDGKLAHYLARRTRMRRIRDLLTKAIVSDGRRNDASQNWARC